MGFSSTSSASPHSSPHFGASLDSECHLLALVISAIPSPRGGGRRGPSDDRRQQSRPQLSGDFIWRQAVAQGSACGLLELPGHALRPRCRSGRRSAPAPRSPDGVGADCPRRSLAAPEDGHDDRFFASCAHAELRPHGWGHSVPFDHPPQIGATETGIWLETIVVTIAGNQGKGHEAWSCFRSSASPGVVRRVSVRTRLRTSILRT